MSANASTLTIPAHGTIFHAPVNTAPPSNPLGSSGFNLQLDGPTPWRNLGHTSKTNTIAFTREGGERTSLDTFLADSVRYSDASTSWGLTVNALQFDEDNLRFAFNGDFDPDTGGYIVATPKPVQTALFLYFQDSTGSLGFWIPNAEMTLGDAPSVDTAAFFELPLTASILSADSAAIAPLDGRAGLYEIFQTNLTDGGGTGGSDD